MGLSQSKTSCTGNACVSDEPASVGLPKIRNNKFTKNASGNPMPYIRIPPQIRTTISTPYPKGGARTRKLMRRSKKTPTRKTR